MNIEDGPQWSPDGGRLWAKNNVAYWADGSVTDFNQNPNLFIRLMPFGYKHTEDYSAWTQEHRAKVLAESQARYAEYEAVRVAQETETERLRESARQKLTREEIEACGLSE